MRTTLKPGQVEVPAQRFAKMEARDGQLVAIVTSGATEAVVDRYASASANLRHAGKKLLFNGLAVSAWNLNPAEHSVLRGPLSTLALIAPCLAIDVVGGVVFAAKDLVDAGVHAALGVLGR